MGATARHIRGKVASGRGAARRALALLAVAAASAVVLTAAVAVSRSGGMTAAGARTLPASPGQSGPSGAAERSGPRARSAGAGMPAGATVALAPGPASRRSCPAAAAACVDLADHLTWLQSGGRVSYGPVRMEPGPPGTRHATPHGTFQVSWKGGPGLVSNEYHEPMPYAVFFAPGGIAFHGGSLTVPSHGCVHLTIADARYYHDHLPVGAEVAVF